MNNLNNNVAILIIFFNKLSQTILCIESFLAGKQNIYILNNASDEASWKLLKQKYEHNKQVFLFHSDVNLGPARGRNLLIEKCNEEWFFFVDNDICIKPEEGWKTLFDKKVEEQKDALIFCPKVFNVHEDSYASPHHFIKKNGVVYLKNSDNNITNYFSCCGVIIHRKIFDTYGNFDNELFAFEDYEFSIRALCSPLGEFKVYPLDEIELIHDHQVQKNKTDKKAVLERYNEDRIKNSLQRLMDKHSIIFDHEWEWWTRKQVAAMNGQTFIGKVKYRLNRLFGRI